MYCVVWLALAWLRCYLNVFGGSVVDGHLPVLFPRPLYTEFSLEGDNNEWSDKGVLAD